MPEGLSAVVSARVGDFTRSLSRAEEALDTVRSAASTAALALGRAESSMDQTRTSALGLSAAVGTAGLSLNAFSTSVVSTTGLVTGLTAVLVGLSTTLVPLAATLGGVAAAATGLAGALGLVVGSGALAFGEELAAQNRQELEQITARIQRLRELQDARESATRAAEIERLEERRQELEDATDAGGALTRRLGQVADEVSGIVAAFGRDFAPLIRDALNAVAPLTRQILRAVGSVDEFRDALRVFGGEAAAIIPDIAGALTRLAREALPIVARGLQSIQQNGGDVFDAILATTRRIAPLILDVGQAFADALPSINAAGIAILETALPAIESGIRGFGNLLDRILAFTQTEQFARILRALRQSASELGPEIDALTANIGKLFDTVIQNAPALIRGATAVADSILDIVNALTPVITAFIDLLGGAADAFATFTRRSERQEANLGEQGVGGFLAGGTRDLLRDARPDSSLQSEVQDELRVVVEAEDEEFDARIDRRIRQDARNQADLVERGAFRGR